MKVIRSGIAPMHIDLMREWLEYSRETGLFVWKKSPSPMAKAGSVAGSPKTGGYIQICLKGKLYTAHRLAWLFVTGEYPVGHIDHIDGDTSNNRFSNLRDTTHTINQQNQRNAYRNNKSGLLGVSVVNSCTWQARITVNRKTYRLGNFNTPKEAHNAYLLAKKQMHPESAINEIEREAGGLGIRLPHPDDRGR